MTGQADRATGIRNTQESGVFGMRVMATGALDKGLITTGHRRFIAGIEQHVGLLTTRRTGINPPDSGTAEQIVLRCNEIRIR